MSHKKTWACIKPDGDGCDGDRTSTFSEAMAEARDTKHYPGDRYAFAVGAEWVLAWVQENWPAFSAQHHHDQLTAYMETAKGRVRFLQDRHPQYIAGAEAEHDILSKWIKSLRDV